MFSKNDGFSLAQDSLYPYQFPMMMSDDDIDGESEESSGVAVASQKKVARPKKFKVLLHNDDYTTMEFVVHVIKKFFNRSSQEAEEIMMTIHTKGVGVCGIYTYEIAETKVSQVRKYSKTNGHPLKCSSEPCEGED